MEEEKTTLLNDNLHSNQEVLEEKTSMPYQEIYLNPEQPNNGSESKGTSEVVCNKEGDPMLTDLLDVFGSKVV